MTPVPPPSAPRMGAAVEFAEPPSDVRQLTAREAKALMRAQEAARAQHDELQRITEAASAKLNRTKNYIWASVGLVISTVVVTASTLVFAQNKIDAGTTKAEATAAERLATYAKYNDARMDRFETKLDRILDTGEAVAKKVRAATPKRDGGDE